MLICFSMHSPLPLGALTRHPCISIRLAKPPPLHAKSVFAPALPASVCGAAWCCLQCGLGVPRPTPCCSARGIVIKGACCALDGSFSPAGTVCRWACSHTPQQSKQQHTLPLHVDAAKASLTRCTQWCRLVRWLAVGGDSESASSMAKHSACECLGFEPLVGSMHSVVHALRRTGLQLGPVTWRKCAVGSQTSAR